jgi:hypothetical protein
MVDCKLAIGADEFLHGLSETGAPFVRRFRGEV